MTLLLLLVGADGGSAPVVETVETHGNISFGMKAITFEARLPSVSMPVISFQPMGNIHALRMVTDPSRLHGGAISAGGGEVVPPPGLTGGFSSGFSSGFRV